MRATVKPCIASLLLSITFHCARAQSPENFLNAPDRIEWDAGGLYDGRFEDGTSFQIQLSYPRPPSVSNRVQQVWNEYWYPRHFTGARTVLFSQEGPAGTITLVQGKPIGQIVETLTMTLAPDRGSGSGSWTTSTPAQQRSFVLHRTLLYKEIAVTRPAPPAPAGLSDNGEPFVFSALFPLLTDAGANDWMRETLSACSDTTECANSVIVAWHSPSLMSLNATTYGYTHPGAHGNSTTSMRHYRLLDGRMVQVGLDAFLEPDPRCRTLVSDAIVAKLRAQKMDGAQHGALNARNAPRFLALPDGLEFHFDPYEVGNYAQGMPSVFLARAELNGCVKNLPADD